MLNALNWELRRYSQRLHMSRAQVILFTPGFHATVVYRLGHLLLPITRKKSGLNIVVALFMAFLRRFTEIITGIYISPEAEIGEGLLMIHFGGITIGPSVIGKNCEIYQGVTLGVSKSLEREVPTLGDRVYLAPGAKVLGNVHVGNDVCVGPNSVLLISVPDRAMTIGVPARVMGKTGSFEHVIYPGMENDPERQKSLAHLESTRVPGETSREEQPCPMPVSA
jgi:serine O-acetyltransferase